MPTVFVISTVDNPLSARDCWGIFANGQRVYGPANVYDCALKRVDLVTAERRHETIRERIVDNGPALGSAVLSHRFSTPNVREIIAV